MQQTAKRGSCYITSVLIRRLARRQQLTALRRSIRRALLLVISGVSSLARTNNCVMVDNEIPLLVQVSAGGGEAVFGLEPQVIADAIAAFAVNN